MADIGDDIKLTCSCCGEYVGSDISDEIERLRAEVETLKTHIDASKAVAVRAKSADYFYR